MASFVVLQGAEPGRRIPVTEPGISFGRTPENTVVLDHPLASRRHAEVRREAMGWVLYDLKSLNGVSVNGTRTQLHRLANGDLVALAGSTLRFEEGPAEPTVAQAASTAPANAIGQAAAQAAQFLPVLVCVQGPMAGQRFGLTPQGTRLGRTPDNTIVLLNSLASRKHAEVRFEAGSWFVYDLGGVNGTFVNNTRVQSHRLSQGDLIGLGHEVFRFEMPSAAAAPAPSPSFAPPVQSPWAPPSQPAAQLFAAPAQSPWAPVSQPAVQVPPQPAAHPSQPQGPARSPEQIAQSITVQCPTCKRRAPVAREDCPWCGTALVNGKTVW